MPLTHIRRIGLPLVAAIAAVGALAAPAAANLASKANPVKRVALAATGTYKTWPAAQRAAGFGLYRPTATYGLRDAGHIIVSVCEGTGKTSRHVVSASYGTFNTKTLGLSQNNSGGACGNANEGSYITAYRIHGVKAQLYGYCNLTGAPSCSTTKVELWLVWKHDGVYYVASSFDMARTRLVHFAAMLKPA
jgi:hypothetical protein